MCTLNNVLLSEANAWSADNGIPYAWNILVDCVIEVCVCESKS